VSNRQHVASNYSAHTRLLYRCPVMTNRIAVLSDKEFCLYTEGQKKKKKKFKLRNNQTVPLAEPSTVSESLDTVSTESSYVDTPRRELPQLRKSRSPQPQLDRLQEDSAGEEGLLSNPTCTCHNTYAPTSIVQWWQTAQEKNSL